MGKHIDAEELSTPRCGCTANMGERSGASGMQMVRTAVFVLSIGAALAASAAEISWNNPAGGSAAVGGNWQGGKVPGAADTALFGLPGTYTVQVPEALTTLGLTATGGDVSLTLPEAGWTLTQPAVNAPGLLVGSAAGNTLRIAGGMLSAALRERFS